MGPERYNSSVYDHADSGHPGHYEYHIRQVNPGVDEQTLLAAFHDTYDDQPFINFTAIDLPTIKQVVGTNNCDIGIAYNPETQFVMVDSVIDNMLKGAAGQAVQNFNVLFGFRNRWA